MKNQISNRKSKIILLVAACVMVFVFVQVSWASSAVFTVSPSGDTSGQTDWNSIVGAFQQAVSAGPGSTVQFAAGDFYVHKPIQIANFSGTVKGTGVGVTNLHTAPGVPFGHCDAPLPPFPGLMMLYFDGSWPAEQTADIVISDLTFRIDGPSQPWGGHDPSNSFNDMEVADVLGRFTGLADFELTRLNVTFEHLEAIGKQGSEYSFGNNIHNAFTVQGAIVYQIDPSSGVILYRWDKPITGAFAWRDIYFENAKFGPGPQALAKDSVITFGGSPQDRILGKNGWVAVQLQDISNSTVEVSHLETYDMSGVILFQGYFAVVGNDLGELVPETMPELSTFAFSHNTIRNPVASTFGGFELWDWAGLVGRKTAQITLSNNNVLVQRPYEPSGAVDSFFIRDAVFENNIITGSGVAGIWVGAFGTPDSGWLMLGNNFQNFNADLAGIYLGPATSSCTVVGGNNSTNVFNEGSGNVLVGVNNMQGNPPGPAVRAAMQQKLTLFKSRLH
jgi:hypothetical protein